MLSDSSSGSGSDSDSDVLVPRGKSKAPPSRGGDRADGNNKTPSSSNSSGNKGGEDGTLKVNQKFARKYEEQQRFKDLQRSKDLLLEAEGDEPVDSESEEEEDETAEALDTKLDLQILNTIESIRKNDPRLFDKSQHWYDEPSSDDGEGADDEEGGGSKKKMAYKDVVREQILKTGTADSSSSDDDEAAAGSKKPRGKSGALAYDREQEEIRKKFLESVKGIDAGSDSDSDSSGDSMLRAKPKTDAEREEEQRLLKEKLDKVIDVNKAEKPDEAKFLYDYLLNKKWNFPKGKSGSAEEGDEEEGEDISDEDEEELDNVDRFESKYNFRFEELADGRGPATVVGHARNVEGSVRRVDDKRKQEREARKERKEREKRQKEAELRRLKNLKRQELEERLKKIMKVGGIDNAEDLSALGITPEALDAEWDPEEHEAQMRKQFGESYYEHDDGDQGFVSKIEQEGGYIDSDDDGKVAEEGADGYDYDGEYGEGEGEGAWEEGAEYGDDGEGYDEGAAEEEEGPSSSKKSKKKSKDDLFDSLYKLDFEDIVAGIPCRFKYRQVAPEDFGLTAEDILNADDDELNQYVSLKKFATYRNKTDKDKDASKLSKKRKRLREVIKDRLAALEKADEEKKNVSGKKAAKAVVEEAESDVEDDNNGGADASGQKKRKRKRNKTRDGEVKLINKFTATESERGVAATTATESKPKKAKKEKVADAAVSAASEKKRRLGLYA